MCGREKYCEPVGLCPLYHTCAGQTWGYKQKGSSSQALWSCMYPHLCSSSGVFVLTAIIDIFDLLVYFFLFGPSQNMV